MKFEIKKLRKDQAKNAECFFCYNRPMYSIKTLWDIEEPFKVPLICGVHMNKFFRKIRNVLEWKNIAKEMDNQVAMKARRKMIAEMMKKDPTRFNWF